MVSPVTFRHPSLVANAATTVDHISGGRVDFGLGAGWYELEHRTYGFPFPPLRERMQMLEEQLEIVIAQWTQDVFSFEGRHYRLERCQANPKPVQRPHPPVIVGGGGKPRTIDLAARFAQEYNVVSAHAEECRSIHTALDEAAARHGREPLVFSFMETTLIGRERDDLMAKANELGRLHWDGASGEQLLAEHATGWICGTVDEAAEQLQQLAAAGVERAMLQHLNHRDLDTVRLIGEELQPRVASL
jgi:alkanesulfonate monooxygenase SsuD/methylene tetrahydromethanopterin reductase-like flavin-dependent oxidoreductase (luciferase family)